MQKAKIWMIISIIIVVVGIPIRILLYGLNDISFVVTVDIIMVGSNTLNYFIEKDNEAKRKKHMEDLRPLYEATLRSHGVDINTEEE